MGYNTMLSMDCYSINQVIIFLGAVECKKLFIYLFKQDVKISLCASRSILIDFEVNDQVSLQ